MQKDFDDWNKEKNKIHETGERPFYHSREIWWCSVGVNIGNELDGTGKEHDRPVLVLRDFNRETFFGVASSATHEQADTTSLSARSTVGRLSRISRKRGSTTPSV